MERCFRHFVAGLGLVLALALAPPAQAEGEAADAQRRRPQLRNFTVTAWWVIFNDPGACDSEAPDGGACLIIPVVDPPLVDDLLDSDGCVIHGTGATVGRGGRVRLVASLYTTALDAQDNPCVLGDAGLIDPLGAEVHLVVRSHEERLESSDLFLDQLTHFNGGCAGGPEDGPNICADLQAAFHAPCAEEDLACDPFRSDRDVLWLPEPFLESAGVRPRRASRLALTKAGTSTLLRSEQGLSLVIETSLAGLGHLEQRDP